MKFIKDHKTLTVIIIIAVLALAYCSFNTFLSNDDLSYMYLYRGTTRVANIFDAVKSQVADYRNLNGRFFVHVIVQTLLIFDKHLWSVLNPIIIASLILVVSNTVSVINREDKYNYKYYLLMISLFLLLINYKYIIYWVCGSVNYLWVSLAMMLFIYYYFKKGLDNHYILNSIFILTVSILHEMSMVFMIVFLIGHFIIKLFNHEKIDKRNLLYLLAITISTLFIMLSPGNAHRMAAEALWASMNIFEKLKVSLPVVSKNLLNLRNYYNIVPIIYIISIIYRLFKYKNKYLMPLLLIIALIALFTNNGYVYILLAVVAFLSEAYIHIKEGNNSLVITSLDFYALVYSTTIVPNYADGRPNFYFYIYTIMIITLFFKDIINKKYFKYGLLMLFIILVGLEVNNYYQIGSIHAKRLKIINECVKANCETLTLPKIPEKYNYYHIDPNSPSDKEYYTYRFYIQYYKLPEEIEIKYE